MSNIKHFFFKALFCASLFPSVNTPMALCANSHDIEALPEPQQQRKVTGVVTDLKGEPIIGANVVVKGSTNGTITDIDGNFSIEVTPNSILQISYIGYVAQEVPVGNKNNLVISIHEDTQKLDEVVVVGYGTQKKVNLTGAVEQVTSEVFENRSVSNEIGRAHV